MKNQNNSENSRFSILFGKKNFVFMGIGMALILIGFLLMTGPDANTRPDGVFDPNYWNEDIFSWRRIRLAPILVIAGFAVNIYAIMLNPKTKTENKVS